MLTRRNFLLGTSALICSSAPYGRAAWGGNGPLTIVVGAFAPPVEHYAARELQKYVRALYKFDPVITTDEGGKPSGPTVLLGSPETNRLVGSLGGSLPWDSFASDGFYLTTLRTSPDVLLVGGRLPRGTLFGVYELAERWGVRFSLSEDILPEEPETLRLQHFDEKLEPAYPVRALQSLNNVPEGSAPWDLSDFETFIDQMAKLKYNTAGFYILPSGPWLDYEFRGVKRPAGDIFYGWRIKTTGDFIGKELFQGRSEFYSPVLGKARNEEERKQLGIGLVRSIIDHSRRRGLMSLLTSPFIEPPTLFKHKMNEWTSLPLPDPKNFPNANFFATPVEELGTNPNYAAWMNVKDPVVKELTELRIKTLIDTYPRADYYYLGVSEHRSGVVDYREIFRELDERYHFTPGFDLNKELNNPGAFAFGLPRYQNQFKGDLLFLYLFDQVFQKDRVLERTSKPGARIMLDGVMPELWPLVEKMLPKGAAFSEFLEYGTHAPAERIDAMVPVLKAKIPSTLQLGLQDDNTMWFPQVNVESQEKIIRATAHLDMQGWVATIWQVRQADINAAYLARASWRPDVTALAFYKDYLPKLVGSSAAPDFETALQTLENADRDVKKHLYGFAFAWITAMEEKFRHVDREAVERLRAQYVKATGELRRAREHATGQGRDRVDFWLKRTDFGIRWLDLSVEAADLGGMLGNSLKAGSPLATDEKQRALAAADQLLAGVRSLIGVIVTDAKSPGDLGEIASLNRYVYQYLIQFREDLARRPLTSV